MATPITSAAENANSSDEMQRLMLAMREALTDSMVERLASTAGVALEVVDRLNKDETRDAIHTIFDRLTEFHRIGALDTLFETVLLLHAVRSAATDNIVERLFGFVEQAANTIGSEAMLQCADDVLTSLEHAAQEVDAEPAKGGLLSTISLLSKPESQQTIVFLLKFAAALQQSQKS
jgi:uncharacterized protein YjgD (DUF1641 family)